MADELLVRFGAPTLAGIKTGSLFSYEYGSRKRLAAELRELNRVLGPKGLRILPMRFGKERVLLYVYRPLDLTRDLGRKDALSTLHETGYRSDDAQGCVAELMSRLRSGIPFPHEIGLFLSYPPEDVRGFIENHAGGYKLIGAWKVYGDVEKARRTFDRYARCTDTYCKQWASGVSIGRLAVAV